MNATFIIILIDPNQYRGRKLLSGCLLSTPVIQLKPPFKKAQIRKSIATFDL